MPVVPREAPSKIPPRLASVPAFPAVAVKLLSLLADGNSSLASISACIATDPVLAARLIARANAADQASYCESRNVLQAVLALGLDRTREISLAIATSAYAGSAIKTEIFRPCWYHTLACALAASEVARQCGLQPAEPYTAGLLHDIGRLGLLAAYRSEYENIVAGAEGQPEDMLALERECFGVDHVEAGVWLARQWKLPDRLIDVIGRHHDAPDGAIDGVAVVQIACRLADHLGFSVHSINHPRSFGEIAAALPEWVRPRLQAQLPLLQAAISRELQLMEASEAPPASPEAIDGELPASPLSPQPDTSAEGTFRRIAFPAIIGVLLAMLVCAAAIFTIYR